MREDYFDLKEIETAQREELARFFPKHVTDKMYDWQKSCWLDIMRRSRFGKLTERSASELALCKIETVCTTLLATFGGRIHFYICDGDNVTAWRVDLLNGYALDHMRQKLHLYLLPASVEVSNLEAKRRGLLLDTLKKCFDSPEFILA